ncbi:MAG: TetR/AcrR family transcriptional regulator [Pseudomonadota bacterium]
MREHRSPGRPRGFDADATLDVIKDLFWARGYEAVSLADVMAATGLRKGSLYAAYGDKRAMYLKALARYDAEQVAETVAALRAPTPPRLRIARFLDAPVAAAYDGADDRGCFLCNAAADRAAEDPDAAALVRTGFEKIERALIDTLAELAPDARRASLASSAAELLVAYSGLRLMARTGLRRDILDAARDRLLAGLPGAP